MQPHAGLPNLVVEADGVHRVFSGNPVGVPCQHHLERAHFAPASRAPVRPRLGAAIAGDSFVREPLDHLATFAGGQFGDFRALFGGGFFLLPARHANVPGRRGQFCV